MTEGWAEVARIVITRELTPEGEDLVGVQSYGLDDGALPLIEALGMVRMAEDTLIRQAMGEVP